MLKLNTLGWVALVLAVIGAINWGLVGIFGGFDVVEALFGEMSALSRIIYILVGLSGIYLVVTWVLACKFMKGVIHRPHPA